MNNILDTARDGDILATEITEIINSPTESPLMSDNHRITSDRDTRIENYTAELTRAVYLLILRHGLKDSWLTVELALWRALAETVQKWARQQPAASSSDELDAWRQGLVVALTESAFDIAIKNGTNGPPLNLELSLYRAVRLVTRRYSRVGQSQLRYS